MGLATTLKKQALKDHEIRVLMLGLDNAGKTTIVKQLSHENINEVSPTLGFSIKTINHSNYNLNIWDVGGQSSLRPFWRNYFEKTDFLVWVLDALALDRLEDCNRILHSILDEDRLLGAGLLIWINKMDCYSEQQWDQIVEKVTKALQLDTITNHQYKVLPCSAVMGINLSEGLDFLVSEVKGRLYLLD